MASRAMAIDPRELTPSAPDIEQVAIDTAIENEIAALAYQLWQERGCPIGSDQQDWFQAERELKSQLTLGRNDAA